jgi:hypothetical protein
MTIAIRKGLPTAAAALAGRLGAPGALMALLQAAGLANAAYDRYVAFRETRRRSRTYTVRVDERDELYLGVHTWLLDRIPAADQRSLVASSARNAGAADYLGDMDDAPPPPVVRYRYSGRESLSTRIGGHPVRVWVDRGEDEIIEPDDGRKERLRPEQVVFEAESRPGLEAVTDMIEGLARERAAQERGPRVYTATSWGRWSRTASLAGRDPATVVLAAGQMERLSSDLGRFLNNEQLYARIGIPWHRGYLLFGAPGTGKTSAARALAWLHRLDVYYLSLPSMPSDGDFAQLLSAVPDRSVLLLEDVDASHAAVSREDGGPQRMSASGLLNALDGIITPHGLVTIMTTNDRDALDPALVRAGRCDVVEEVGYLTDEQAARLVAAMTGRACPLPSLDGRTVAPAALVEVVKRHLDDLDAARSALVAYLRDLPREAAA